MIKIPRLLVLQAPVAVCLNRYDRFTTGANTHETKLNSSNVNISTFGKLYSYYVDGAVYGQPLCLAGLEIPGLLSAMSGIESTPVIDSSTDSLYLAARTKETGRYVQRLHRLDIRKGSDLVPAAIIEASTRDSAPDAIDGFAHFDPRAGNQRTALALVNGMS